MSYILKKSNNETLIVLNDGQVDTALTSLTLVGKNVSNYGNAQNENYLYLLENFANSSLIGGQPKNPIKGQLWFDSNPQVNRLLIYDGTQWRPLGVTIYGSSVTNSLVNAISNPPIPYSAAQPGDLWFNSQTNQLFGVTTTNSDTILIGPESVSGFGTTKMSSTSMFDINGNPHPVIQTYVDGEVVILLSNSTFVSTTTNSLNGFPVVYRGITFRNYNSSTRYSTTVTDVVLHGLHEQLDQSYPRRNLNEHIQGNWSIDNGSVLYFGSTSQSSISYTTSGLQLISNNKICLQSTNSLIFDGTSLTPSTSTVTLGTTSSIYNSVYSSKVSSGNNLNIGLIEGNWQLTIGSQLVSQVDLGSSLGSLSSRFNTIYSTGLNAGNSGVIGAITGIWQLSPLSIITPSSDLASNLGQPLTRFNTAYISSLSGVTSIIGNPTVSGNILPSNNNAYNLGSSGTNWSNVYANTVNSSVLNSGINVSNSGSFNYLTVTTSSISQLIVDRENVGLVIANTATIGTLTVPSATAGTINSNQLITSYGTIVTLNSTNGSFDTVTANNGNILQFYSSSGTINNFTSTNVTANNLQAGTSVLTTLTVSSATVTNLCATAAVVELLTATNATVNSNITAFSANFKTLTATTATLYNLTVPTATITNAIVSNLSGNFGTMNSLNVINETVASLIATTATVSTLKDTSSHIINKFDPDGTLSANLDTNLSTQKAVKTYVDTTSGYLLSLINDLQNIVANFQPTPTGTIFYTAGSTAPPGFLIADGSSYPVLSYFNLFSEIGYRYGGAGGSFNVPDLRGQFIRGIDNGRGIDPGRVLGSNQIDAFKSHTHLYQDSWQLYDAEVSPGVRDAYGNFVNYNENINAQPIGVNDNDAGSYEFTRVTQSTGGSETRPTNVALLPIIKT